jgi:hypothetical protein
MTLNVETVATDANLQDELGGAAALANLVADPDADPSITLQARTLTLAEVLSHLANRTPPVRPEYLSNASELGSVVVYGALARLFRNNITTGGMDDVNAAKHRIYQKLYESSLIALRPSQNQSVRSGSSSIGFSRR